MFDFTYSKIEEQYKTVKDLGYTIITCEEFMKLKASLTANSKIVVNRVDIDFSVKKAKKLIDIFTKIFRVQK